MIWTKHPGKNTRDDVYACIRDRRAAKWRHIHSLGLTPQAMNLSRLRRSGTATFSRLTFKRLRGQPPQAMSLSPLRGLPADRPRTSARWRSSSGGQESIDHRRHTLGVGEVDVVAALDLDLLEDRDHRQPRLDDVLGKRPALQRTHRQHRTGDGGQESPHLVGRRRRPPRYRAPPAAGSTRDRARCRGLGRQRQSLDWETDERSSL